MHLKAKGGGSVLQRRQPIWRVYEGALRPKERPGLAVERGVHLLRLVLRQEGVDVGDAEAGDDALHADAVAPAARCQAPRQQTLRGSPGQESRFKVWLDQGVALRPPHPEGGWKIWPVEKGCWMTPHRAARTWPDRGTNG